MAPHSEHNERVLRELEIGDMVEFPRNDLYSHWGVYLGDNNIVHLTGDGNPGLFSISGVGIGSQAVVRIDKFWIVADGCKAKKNNSKDNERQPRPPSEIMKKALEMRGKAEFHVLWNNCEHFATNLRYGEKSSKQGTIAAAVLGGAAVGVLGFPGALLAGAVYLSMKRNGDHK